MGIRVPGGARLRRPVPRRSSRGMVTVELAIGMVTAVLLTAGLVSLSLLGVTQAACEESAAQIARQQARGDLAAVTSATDRMPDGAVLRMEEQRDGVRAHVSVEVSILRFGPITVAADAWAAYEPGVAP